MTTNASASILYSSCCSVFSLSTFGSESLMILCRPSGLTKPAIVLLVQAYLSLEMIPLAAEAVDNRSRKLKTESNYQEG